MPRALATCLHLHYIDRDRLVWREGWIPVPPEERTPIFDRETASDAWAYDGHLRLDRPEEQLVLARCDTVIWLDLSRWTVMRAVTWRTVRRMLTRERLPGGNRENWRTRLSPRFNVGWAWRAHSRLRSEYELLFSGASDAGRLLVRLRSRREMNRWLVSVCAGSYEHFE